MLGLLQTVPELFHSKASRKSSKKAQVDEENKHVHHSEGSISFNEDIANQYDLDEMDKRMHEKNHGQAHGHGLGYHHHHHGLNPKNVEIA